MKVALICHFSNKEVRAKLPLDYKRRLYFFVNRVLGRSTAKMSSEMMFPDVSPWVTMIINEFKKKEDIELVVISAHTGMKRILSHFDLDSVRYYFFNTDISLFLKRLFTNPKLWRIVEPNSSIVRRIINKEKPDIINLIGSDGAYFSSTVLRIRDIPILVALQTVYTNPDRYKHSVVDVHNWFIETEVFKHVKYYACASQLHYNLLKSKRPDAIALRFSFPNNDPRDIKDAENLIPTYDFVTFAQNCSTSKGTFDALEAFVLVHKEYPGVTLNICGMRDSEAESIMTDIIERNNIRESVFFTNFFEEQNDLFKHLKKSRFAVLPVKLDVIPGTVTQAMALGLPVITNITSGTPQLNKEKECVALTPIDNIQELALNMIRLYEDIDFAKKMKMNALEYIGKMMTNEQKVDLLVDDLKSVYNHYHNGDFIPEELFFKGTNI
ncbi:MAG: glycosyltransferase family 4 protein [Prevotella sp.]|nr:glycosyltransferase family 4 protein [Candidatus Equicola faecalis]